MKDLPFEDKLREITKEPPTYEDAYKKGDWFPSLIDLAYEAVHMGADQHANRLLDLRKFLIEHFQALDACAWAEKKSNEEAYTKPNPRELG